MPQYTKIDYKGEQQRDSRVGNQAIDVFKFIDMRGVDECWPWCGSVGGRATDPRPYFQASGRRTLAYRWVFELVNGIILKSEELILHSCDNGRMPIGCCNPKHMRVGTHEDNNKDKALRSRGGLPAPVVRAIRRLLDRGETHADIADLYGVSRTTITAIANNVTHVHTDVPDDEPEDEEDDNPSNHAGTNTEDR